jgi:hypothetical protein
MDDDIEIERMLEEKMQEDLQKKEPIINKNGDKKDKDKDKDKKHKKHQKHHKSHKSDKKHERKRSRSPRRSRSPVKERRHRSPTPTTLASGKRRDVNSELHQLAKTLSRHPHPKEPPQASKANRRDKSPELTPEERDLRTVFCKENLFNRIFISIKRHCVQIFHFRRAHERLLVLRQKI